MARGLHFCLPPKEVDKYDVKCSFELLYCDLVKLNVPLTSENQDRLRSQLKNISYNCVYSYDFSKQKNILSKDEWRALNDLRSDDSIIITKPDKRNGLVIVSRLDYLNKMKHLLSDNTKFKPLTHNPTKAREESLSSYLRKLRKDRTILMTQFSRRFYPVVLPQVSYMASQRFTRLDAPSALLFPQ